MSRPSFEERFMVFVSRHEWTVKAALETYREELTRQARVLPRAHGAAVFKEALEEAAAKAHDAEDDFDALLEAYEQKTQRSDGEQKTQRSDGCPRHGWIGCLCSGPPRYEVAEALIAPEDRE